MRRLIAGSVAVLLALAGCSSAEGQNSGPEGRGTKAWVMCEEFIKQRMGGDLDFGGHSATSIQGEGQGPYTVASTVNGNKYRCSIRSDEAGDEWTLVDLNVAR